MCQTLAFSRVARACLSASFLRASGSSSSDTSESDGRLVYESAEPWDEHTEGETERETEGKTERGRVGWVGMDM